MKNAKAIAIIEKVAHGCKYDLQGLKDALEDEKNLAGLGVTDKEETARAHRIIVEAIACLGDDFPAAPYYGTCTKTDEIVGFDTEKEAQEWIKEMYGQFPCGFLDTPPALGWEMIVKKTLGYGDDAA